MEWLCQRPETNKSPQNKLTLEACSRSSWLTSKVAEKTPPTHPEQGRYKEFSHHSRISWDVPWDGQASLGAQVRALPQTLGGGPGCKLIRGDTGHLTAPGALTDSCGLLLLSQFCSVGKVSLCAGEKKPMASRNGFPLWLGLFTHAKKGSI